MIFQMKLLPLLTVVHLKLSIRISLLLTDTVYKKKNMEYRKVGISLSDLQLLLANTLLKLDFLIKVQNRKKIYKDNRQILQKSSKIQRNFNHSQVQILLRLE